MLLSDFITVVIFDDVLNFNLYKVINIKYVLGSILLHYV